MKLNYLKIICISIPLALSSCGYSMRGTINIPDLIKSVSVQSSEYSELVDIINASLVASDINLSTSKNKDIYKILILSENFNRRQLSINISGRVNEYELIYDVNFELQAPNKKAVKEKITLYRDYSFDENNVMGNTDREDEIRKNMMSTASSLIFHKLKASANK